MKIFKMKNLFMIILNITLISQIQFKLLYFFLKN